MGLDMQVEKGFNLVFLQDGHGGPADGCPCLQAAPVELGEQVTQSGLGCFESLLTAVSIPFALLAG